MDMTSGEPPVVSLLRCRLWLVTCTRGKAAGDARPAAMCQQTKRGEDVCTDIIEEKEIRRGLRGGEKGIWPLK